MRSQFLLSFMSAAEIQLSHVEYLSATTGLRYRSVRGKTEGAFRGAGTFQWTAAVKGLSVLAIRTAACHCDPAKPMIVEGDADSLASSFDYAISKGPAWLTEMFGTEKGGEYTAKRLFRRSNPNRKRPGPVAISVNQTLLPAAAIEIEVNGRRIADADELESLAARIEREAAGHSSSLSDAEHGMKLVVNK